MSSAPTAIGRALLNEADQLSMFGADASADEVDALRDAKGRLPADAFRRLRRGNGKRGPGRPLGAVGKRNEQLAKLVMQEYGDPVLGGAALYAMPLDQLCEMLQVADGSRERQEQQDELLSVLAARVEELTLTVRIAARSVDPGELTKAADRLADAAEALQDTSTHTGKSGALALQALNLQLMARRFVAEYVHSKRAVAVDVTHKTDGLLVMPSRGGAGSDEAGRVKDQLNALVANGVIAADQVARLEWRDGRLHDPEGEIVDADFVPVADGEDEDGV